MKSFLWIALGGAIGSVLRYVVSLWIRPEQSLAFPIHTFIVNIAGCLLIGLVFSWLVQSSQEQYRLFIITGVLGGFTTFSSFGLETFYLFQHGETMKASLYILLSNVLGIASVWLGHLFYKLI